MKRIRLILAGGFLGAGKTTLLLRSAQHLAAQGRRVGLVTNDQAADLVDTALAHSQAVPVVEVAGGCFCCRFPDLIGALQELQRSVQPEIILAEPVGSCTDLMATVLRPLMAYHADAYEIAPLTVLLDPTRQVEPYGEDVTYLYRQQLAEAEVILLNKADLVAPDERTQLQHYLAAQYAPVQIRAASASTGEGLNEWLTLVLGAESQLARRLTIDYARYAAAEAELGWCNLRGLLYGEPAFSPVNWATHLLRMLDQALAGQGAAIAHVKLQISAGEGVWKVSLTQSNRPLTWDARPTIERVSRLEFVFNARVHASPERLEATIRRIFAEMTPPPAFHFEFAQFQCFRPAAPVPTYRIAEV